MRKILLAVFLSLIVISSSVFAQASDLFISEYVEGASSNKGLEIYNGTGGDVDLAGYRLVLATNGAATPGTIQALSGTLANNDVFCVVNSSAVAGLTDHSDLLSTVTYYNGDDFIGLQKYDTPSQAWVTIDAFGQLGNDPGTAWNVAGVTNGTLDYTLVRKASITKGNTDWAASFGTDADNSEWIVYPKDTFTYFGSHTMDLPLVDFDLNLTFEDNSEVTKWSHWNEANLYTTEAYNATAGVEGS
ncbi:MAG: lamin tail domain-containing protein, partial [Bacteroidetes bacterium]|nr:lamin tail domain-containing protein [Bacteroidota bacterium]